MKRALLQLFLILAVLILPWISIICVSFWLLQRLTPTQFFELSLSHPLPGPEIMAQWQKYGLGMDGIHFFLDTLFAPVFVPVILIQITALLFIWILHRFYRQQQDSIKNQILKEQFDRNTSLSRLLADKWTRKERRMTMVQEQRMEDRHSFENTLHELRSKLMSLYFLAADTPAEKEIDEVLQACDHLIYQTLQESVISACSLNDLVEQALHSKSAIFKEKNIQIESHLRNIHLLCDGLWLRQVLETALSNALEATTDGNTISVSSDFDENRRLAILTVTNPSAEGGTVSSLTGTSRYSSRTAGHFGIGLSMAEEVMKKHHGYLEAFQDKDHFVLRLSIPVSEMEEKKF